MSLSPVRTALRSGPSDQFTATRVNLDVNGASHVRFERRYAGLRVMGGDFVLHSNAAGAVEGVSSTLSQPISLSTTPKHTAAQALAQAERQLDREGGSLRHAGTPELVVAATWAVGAPRLAWQVSLDGVAADALPTHLVVLVSATDGGVLDSWDEVKRGTGTGVHEGTVHLDTTSWGCRVRCGLPRGLWSCRLRWGRAAWVGVPGGVVAVDWRISDMDRVHGGRCRRTG